MDRCSEQRSAAAGKGHIAPSPLIVLRTLAFGVDLPGYASLIVAVLFLGGIQLIGIGVLGEYIGRIYIDVKRRPHYFVRAVHQGSEPLR